MSKCKMPEPPSPPPPLVIKEDDHGIEIRDGISNTNLKNYCYAIMALYSVETLF